MITIRNGTVVLTNTVLISKGKGAAPACPICEKNGISKAYMDEVMDHRKESFYLCPCGFAYPTNWTWRVVRILAQKRLEFLQAEDRKRGVRHQQEAVVV